MRIFLLAIIYAALSLPLYAQTPNYVPTNGLTSWWPLDGNAVDQSGTGNNGTINGALPTSDRKGNLNHAYTFNGLGQFIQVEDSPSLKLGQSFTISLWTYVTAESQTLIRKGKTYGIDLGTASNFSSGTNVLFFIDDTRGLFTSSKPLPTLQWLHLVASYDGLTTNFYVNGSLIQGSGAFTGQIQNDNNTLIIGSLRSEEPFFGKIDDVGIWNRALTKSEIQGLFQGCDQLISEEPNSQHTTLQSKAIFSSSAASNQVRYNWQTNPYGLGWQNLRDISQFNGSNTAQLSISAIRLSNQNQQFRLIANDGYCSDTSITVSLFIQDTCADIVHDTVKITVTDTLLIQTTVTGANKIPFKNNFKVYPNPAHNVLIIDNGNFGGMEGFSIEINNILGENMFRKTIIQHQFEIDISNWLRKGIYFISIRNRQNIILETRQIVIE